MLDCSADFGSVSVKLFVLHTLSPRNLQNELQHSSIAASISLTANIANIDAKVKIFLHFRNEYLMQQTGTSHFPKAKKTGTTIAGILFKDGVVLGADTRATEVVFTVY